MSVVQTQVWVNGEPNGTLSPLDRGLQYGDGFFTTLLVAGGQVFNWEAHWRRLKLSAERLGFPALDEVRVWREVETVLRESETLRPQVLKLIISRGQGGRGYLPPPVPQVNHVVHLSDHPLWERIEQMADWPSPVSVMLCETRCAIQPQLAGVKHLNRLENVLARAELSQNGVGEGLMLDQASRLICATQSNLFLIKNNRLLTPDLNLSGVEGTTRYQLKSVAESLGLKWQEQGVDLKTLESADELFLTNAVRGVMPVERLLGAGMDERFFATDKTQRLHQAWYEWQRENAKRAIPC